MKIMRIICQLSILMKYLALFCYFLKSSKIWNCRLLQIIGDVLWTNSDIFILAGFQTSEVGRVIDKSCGYVCGYCCKAFQTKYQLKRHEIIHSDEKPFKCDHCDKVFKDKSVLRRHCIRHTGQEKGTLNSVILREF